MHRHCRQNHGRQAISVDGVWVLRPLYTRSHLRFGEAPSSYRGITRGDHRIITFALHLFTEMLIRPPFCPPHPPTHTHIHTHLFFLLQSKFGPEGRTPDKATVEVSSILSVCSGCPNREQLLQKELLKDMLVFSLLGAMPDVSLRGVSLKCCSKCEAVK
jgi:hypothetical protein